MEDREMMMMMMMVILYAYTYLYERVELHRETTYNYKYYTKDIWENSLLKEKRGCD